MPYSRKFISFNILLLLSFIISCRSNITPTITVDNFSPIVYPPHINKPYNVTFDFNNDYKTLKIDFEPSKKGSATWCRFNTGTFDNIEIKDGNLVIRATYDKEKNKFSTGAIYTKKIYGLGTRISVRSSMNKKIKGAFPAIWLNPSSWKPSDGSPKPPWPNNGEIDLFEYVDKRSDEVPQTIHSVNKKDNKLFSISKYTKANTLEWHTYTCDILEDRVILYLDDRKTLEYVKEENIGYPFEYVKYNLVLNSALHGSWGTDIEEGNNRYYLPYELLIDWIHIEKIDPKTGEPIK